QHPRQPALTFADRHIGPRESDQAAMLARGGYDSHDALMQAAVPDGIRRALEGLPDPLAETAVTARLRERPDRNHPGVPVIGMGYHGTITPAVIRRNVLEDPGWYTAYTPYQPEISQGRLE